jgi:hypothetical protein
MPTSSLPKPGNAETLEHCNDGQKLSIDNFIFSVAVHRQPLPGNQRKVRWWLESISSELLKLTNLTSPAKTALERTRYVY